MICLCCEGVADSEGQPKEWIQTDITIQGLEIELFHLVALVLPTLKS